MHEIPSHLIELAHGEIRSVEEESGETVSAREAAEIALSLFEFREEWSAVSEETGQFGQSTPISDSPLEVIRDYGKERVMAHRFVAQTPWVRIRAHVEWEET